MYMEQIIDSQVLSHGKMVKGDNGQPYPLEVQAVISLVKENGVDGLFPQYKKELAEKNRQAYEEGLRNYVWEALNERTDATLVEVMLLILPKLPKGVHPNYLVNLIKCAEKILAEKREPVSV
jgi:hypothetical protein